MPRSSRERLLRHCDRTIGNIDKAFSHLRNMELEYSVWKRELPEELKIITFMLIAVQEKVHAYAETNLRA